MAFGAHLTRNLHDLPAVGFGAADAVVKEPAQVSVDRLSGERTLGIVNASCASILKSSWRRSQRR